MNKKKFLTESDRKKIVSDKEKAILEIPNETTIGMLLESSQIQEITDHNGENKLRVLLVGLIVKLG